MSAMWIGIVVVSAVFMVVGLLVHGADAGFNRVERLDCPDPTSPPDDAP